MPPTRRTTTVEFVRGSVRGTRRRALATLPSLFTLGNMLCGFAAILVSIRGEYPLAAVLIGLSVVFDITDGAVARLVGAVTPFGLQFDSLADLVSFGLAPALLAFTLFSEGRDQWDPLGWIACFLWVACAAIRLARFNTTIDPTADKRYFVGMPSPGAAGVVLASVFAFGDQMQGRDRLWVLLPVVVPALLMVSNIRFRSFRSLVSPKSGRPYGLIAMAVVLVVGFALIPAITGIAVAYGYLLAPLLLPVVAPLSRLLPAKLKEMLS
jgi:CDP-diacylglycerol---serine O-phosphatidyltransferase